MFGGLFEEDDSTFDTAASQVPPSKKNIVSPSSPRSGTNLCGLSNLGATCYMNALLQTMTYTPELREAIFLLTEAELGLEGNESKDQIRAIPVQLQNLFARILLLNQSSTGVEGLVSSFGWTNNEQLQQHDVQELNRILFDALESSLVGTSGHMFVHQLFHGTSIQRIVCCVCGQVSEREEDFLDIPVPLCNTHDLENALKEVFCDTECLEGSNQYRCEKCQGLVDAERFCRLRSLPPILTFALLRFLYDFEKGERYKDTNSFRFPLSIDMTPYSDISLTTNESSPIATPTATPNSLVYDLYSLVIHSGSTHSGHYTAYIRDIDGLGKWTNPKDEPVTIGNLTDVSNDPLEFNSPLELLQALLRQTEGTASLNSLCKRLQDQTGVTWNKRFKQAYGPIKKFMEKHSEAFILENNGNTVTLKTTPTFDTDTVTMGNEGGPKDCEATPTEIENMATTEPESMPPIGECWYEFNDSRVSCISTDSIKKMYQGRESAYMLFYRKRSLIRQVEALGNPYYCVPERLKKELLQANKTLEEERKRYDLEINSISLTIHLAPFYTQRGGALQNNMDGLTRNIDIDRRLTLDDLQTRITSIVEDMGLMALQLNVIYTARLLPVGLHLYEHISTDPSDDSGQKTLLEVGLSSDMDLFVWDGIQVDGEPYLVGYEHEPLHLHLNYPTSDGMTVEVSRGFPKSTILFTLREYFSEFLSCSPNEVTINQVKQSLKSGNTSAVTIPSSKDALPLCDVPLSNDDHLAAEVKDNTGKDSKSFAKSIVDMKSKLMTFIIENRCTNDPPTSDSYSIHSVEVSKTERLSQVKQHIISQLGLVDVEGGGRLRLDDDIQGLGPPLCEDQTLTNAGITPGCRVVLEKGTSPSTTEICLNCSPEDSSLEYCDIIVDKHITVKECCIAMVKRLGLIGLEWHLRKTNWCGEMGEVLDDEEGRLEKLYIKSGDSFVVESGKLPPKGFVRISIHKHDQLTQSDNVLKESSVPDNNLMNEVTTPLHELDPTQFYPPPVGVVTKIGTIEIRREATLDELKQVIITLPAISSSCLPSIKYLRVRSFADGKRLGKIYRQSSLTLKQMKLYSGGDICLQVLSFEEDLLPSQIVFYLQVRNSIERQYSPPFEVTYDTALSTTPTGIRNFVANLLGLPLDKTALAKHKFESFKWIKIEDKDSGRSQSGTKIRKAKSKSKSDSSHINIKNSPILLRDGDIIGVKDLRNDENNIDDFTTVADDRGSAVLLAIQEEKRKRRKVKAADGDSSGISKRQRLPEIGIKIFVPDFTTSKTGKS